MSLPDQIHHFIQEHRLISPGDGVVIGVSGGADSLALLHLLHHLRPRLGCWLHVATFDHQLRGADSAADVRFVVQTARAWGLPVTTGQADVRSSAQPGGIEQAARHARYDFLAQTARTVGASSVAVAHHAGDQAETILIHIIRGTGTQGLMGMAARSPVPGHPALTLIRPLLTATRAQIEAYCQQHGLAPRQDATNQDTAYLRNRLRLETLPALRQLNPQIDQALIQLADIVAADNDYIQQQLDTAITDRLARTDGRIALDRARFAALHPALQRRFVHWAAGQLGDDTTGYQHIIHALQVAQGGQTGAQAVLPGGLRLRVDYTTIVIEQEAAPAPYNGPRLPPDAPLHVIIPGTTSLLDGWVLHTSPAPTAPDAQPLAIRPGQTVVLRTRRTGDRFAPLGMDGHTQTLKKWLVDHKIPAAIRDHLPLLLAGDDIAALYTGSAWAVSQHYAVDTNSQHIIYFHFTQTAES